MDMQTDPIEVAAIFDNYNRVLVQTEPFESCSLLSKVAYLCNNHLKITHVALNHAGLLVTGLATSGFTDSS